MYTKNDTAKILLYQRKLIVFHWIMRESKSPQIPRTLLSILTLLENKKKKRNMKVTVIPIVIRILGTVVRRLVKGLEDTIQLTALLL